ncbi:MAG TPA: beta-galactosidase [Candidatus Saccharimonadales bacterium]|nr:beta-galactosidase [Candidatus Saccharimonadales bacterium]
MAGFYTSITSFGRRCVAVIHRCATIALPKNVWLRRGVITLVTVIAVAFAGMYGIGQWYIWSERHQPLNLGVSFVADYASFLGVDPHTTFLSLLHDLHVRQFRLVSYWSDIEPAPGSYDFSELDWEMQQAAAAGAKVTLVVGLRQPRWPECHAPSWVNGESTRQWQPQLESFMATVVNRYKNNPALQSYQLENEYFLKQYGFFGACTDFSRSRLVDEYNLVKRLDPRHPIIVGRSNNDLGWPVGAPTPDTFSVSVYQRVWDATVTHRYLQYPFPAWYYAFLAGWQKIVDHRDMVIGELQAEPWPPRGQTIPETPLAEQNKSFNAQRLQQTIAFGKGTGMRSINLWGAEYWYYRMVKLHDPSVWNAARRAFE